jgi:hypothetical protein
MKRFSILRILAVGIALSGCTVPIIRGYETGSTPSVNDRMRGIAMRYELDFGTGGMFKGITYIQDCYQRATGTVVQVFVLRDCMIYDDTAYHIDQVYGGRINGTSLPYFEDHALQQRMAQYGPLAQFDSVPRMVTYIQNTHHLVEKYMRGKRLNCRCFGNPPDPDCT